MGFMDKINAAQAAVESYDENRRAKLDDRKAKLIAKQDERKAKLDDTITDENGWLTFSIHEDGRNGNVKVAPGRLIRTVKKGIAKQDDTVLITYASIQSLKIERKLGYSSIVISTSVGNFKWKVTAAERMKEAIEAEMFA